MVTQYKLRKFGAELNVFIKNINGLGYVLLPTKQWGIVKLVNFRSCTRRSHKDVEVVVKPSFVLFHLHLAQGPNGQAYREGSISELHCSIFNKSFSKVNCDALIAQEPTNSFINKIVPSTTPSASMRRI